MRRILHLLILPLFTAPLAAAEGEQLPVREVHDFVAPLFDLDAGGVKVGELRGATAKYLSTTMADLTQFKYTAFAPDQSVQFSVESDHATVLLHQKIAFGEGTIHAVSPDYEITGRDWRIDAAEQNKRIVINEGAHIVFRAVIGDILK